MNNVGLDIFFNELKNVCKEVKVICEEHLEYFEIDEKTIMSHDEEKGLLLNVLLGAIVAEFVEPNCKKGNFSILEKLFNFLDKNFHNLHDEKDTYVDNSIAVSFLAGIVNEDYMKDIKTHNLLGNNLKKGIKALEDY